MTVPAYAGLPGLYRCHPVELASQLFGMLFGGGSLLAPSGRSTRWTSVRPGLLRRGEELLRSADPVRTLHGWLPAEPELR